uniref:Uncharacterized protein n=1 Tax=Nelumbo nucifera TaxID=4432 RepID=A0A822ZKD9_NELNU|nr:TPA_asm: hypothetical protein HUJ06_016481 [Nelumbo nucifera]
MFDIQSSPNSQFWHQFLLLPTLRFFILFCFFHFHFQISFGFCKKVLSAILQDKGLAQSFGFTVKAPVVLQYGLKMQQVTLKA